MADFLAKIAELSRQRAQATLAETDLARLRERALASPRPPRLKRSPFVLIAEVKRASPSEGRLSDDSDAIGFVTAQARRYAQAGAGVISVLTEPSAFAGDLAHAAAAAAAVDVPVMRKDFLVHPAQVYEARLAGCGGVLLITRMLGDDSLRAMLAAAEECGLFALVESFDRADLERTGAVLGARGTGGARGGAPVMVGVNSRDLATLGVAPASLASLAAHLPAGYVAIAESGMHSAEDVAGAVGAGYDGALVGTALMRAADAGSLAAGMISAGRRAALLRGGAGWMGRTRVKVCGVSDAAMAAVAVACGVDAVGCVLAESPRRVSVTLAEATLAGVPAMVARVAVFKTPTAAEVEEAARLGVFTAVQADASCEGLVRAVLAEHAPGVVFVPVHRMGAEGVSDEGVHAGLCVLEGPKSGVGQTVDWGRAAVFARGRRTMLAGGLHPGNVAEAMRVVRPFAVDVSSGVETAPGRKDAGLIADFLAAVRAADAEAMA